MSATHQLLRFGVFELNVTTGELRKSGALVKLPPQAFRLLALLASRAGQPVTRDEIQKQLWDEESLVDFEHGVNKCIKQIRNALGDDIDTPLYIETLPRLGYRFVAPVVSKVAPAPRLRVVESESSERKRVALPAVGTENVSAATAGAAAGGATVAAQAAEFAAAAEPDVAGRPEQHFRGRGVYLFWGLVALGLAAIAGGLYWRSRKMPALTERDTVVIAEFENRTGDTVFDGTLRQGLSAQLEQSPFLDLLSDDRIAQTLSFMEQPRDIRLSGELAREVCQRTASAATIEGSISTLGSQYVVGLKALDCRTGDLLGEEQVTANGKEQVLSALGDAATKLRHNLGESLASVQNYDAPMENATTSSLEALKAYSVGYQAMVVSSDYSAATPLFQRAISLDPNFAMAYARLGMNFDNLGETARATQNLREAYDLRERISEREKFYIESHYEQLVLGDLDAARKTCELWRQTYPRDPIPPDTLSYIYASLGDYDSALAAAQQRLKLAPGSALSYGNLVIRYVNLNHLDEAKATAQEAQSHNIDAPIVRLNVYLLNFLQHDQAGMERESAAMMGKPRQLSQILYLESDTAAFAGQFAKARELTLRAADSAQRSDHHEAAAEYVAEGAVREALVGNVELARQQAQVALASSDGRDVEAISAIGLALAGDSSQANQLIADLAKRFPVDTVVQVNYLPTIGGATAVRGGNADKAIAALAPATPYELGATVPYSAGIANFSLYPVYVRGAAYLALHQGAAAAAEFEKILAHPGIVLNQPIGALAHLQLGRAYALQGNSTKAKAEYQDFLSLWQNADPGLPVLKQAKDEYAKLATQTATNG